MRVQLADADQPHAQSAAVRLGAIGRRHVLVVFVDRPGSGLFQRLAQSSAFLEETHLALMLDISPN